MEEHLPRPIELLPYSLRDGLRHYLAYVNDALIDVAREEGVYDRLGELRPQVDVLFTLRFLHGHVVLGFRNFQHTLRFLESRGVDGFQIGSTTLTSRSPLTAEWRRVAGELDDLVAGIDVAPLLTSTLPVSELIRELTYRILSKGATEEIDD